MEKVLANKIKNSKRVGRGVGVTVGEDDGDWVGCCDGSSVGDGVAAVGETLGLVLGESVASTSKHSSFALQPTLQQ